MKLKILFICWLTLTFEVYGRVISDNNVINSIHSNPDEKNHPAEPHEWIKLTKVPPANIYHDIGSITEIECEALGSPIPEIQWFPRDVNRESNTVTFMGPSTLVKVRSILLIDHLKHTRSFSCVASAAGKQVTTTTTVHPKNINNAIETKYEPRKPKIIYNYSLYLETVGSTILLPCRTAANHQKTEKYWLDSNGNVINGDNPRLKINSDGDLIIIDLKWDDMGAYKCVVENLIGRDAADTFVYPALNEE